MSFPQAGEEPPDHGESMMMTTEVEPTVLVDAASVQGGPVLLSLRGAMSLDTISTISHRLYSLVEEMNPSDITIDFSSLGYFDSAGALVMARFRHEMERRGIPLKLVNVSEETRRIMELFDPDRIEVHADMPSGEPPISMLEIIGGGARAMVVKTIIVMGFIGDVVRSIGYFLFHPRELRWKDMVTNMKLVGADGLPIVALISFLVGLIIAFMSSLQLKPLGGDIFVASLVGIAIVKELGPLMTAIIVAGRSGSAFAAEIGAMVANEEIDALYIMGFEPMRFLVIPRLLAALAVVPLLALYADFFGLFGGLVVGMLGLDMTLITYVNQTGESIVLSDVFTGLIKSIVFAAIVGGSGCYHGLRVKRGAEGVGRATTAAVVSAIFFIILADSIFAVVLHYI